ncbi:MAG: glutaminase A [Alphaproteobacteria bacterium]|nr:glutaminase A [Alphaproteobacteria bacterium]
MDAGTPLQAAGTPKVATLSPLAQQEVTDILQRLHGQFLGNSAGNLADYIPQLARVDPDQFGTAIAMTTGQVLAVGDADAPFTIQSVSKALTVAMLLDRVGYDATRLVVGTQPSGDPFNSITLDPQTNRPFNPMVNAGAIAVTGRILELLGDSAFDCILETFSKAAGRELTIDREVFESERETGHRNRAIGHLLRAAEVFTIPVDPVLDLYFMQCSIVVTARDLAAMGATLANLGLNPVTGQHVFGLEAVRDTVSVMFTCGMYNGAGDWACRVGVPAKSGVGGGIMAVLNRQLGIGVFSPRLDSAGNSVRGQLVCRHLAHEMGLHAFDCTNMGSSFLTAYGIG